MNILVFNCGSSSVKYKLFDMSKQALICYGGVEKIGLHGSFMKLNYTPDETIILEGEILEHTYAIEYILGVLTSKEYGCMQSLDEINAVGHRVVHGGDKFNKSVRITEEVIEQLQECIEIAPLHNPPNLKGIYAIAQLLPAIPQVAVFDTAFHQTMPEKSYMYAIPYSLYKKYGIRRYGFHGTSHRFVSKRAIEMLSLPESNRIITCHIGNGASMAAIKDGKSIDTSMGFTPVEGLMMGTRAGDIDAGILSYLMDKENIGTNSISTIVNKYGGLLGISGISSDMRDIQKAYKEGHERATLALEMYWYRIKKYIGSYAAAMDGTDCIIFTGGVGENDALTRENVCDGLQFMGAILDKEKNNTLRGTEGIISTADSKIIIAVIPTNEELMIAQDTLDIVT